MKKQSEKAQILLANRHFQPWEGGEGQVLGQHVRTHLILGREALARKDLACALACFSLALDCPENLSEACHLLANRSEIHYWVGEAYAAAGDCGAAFAAWTIAATFNGDFQNMRTQSFSEMTYFSALALERLGEKRKAGKLFRELLCYAEMLHTNEAKIDYFATSLPTMLLFDDELQYCQETTALFIQAQAQLGLRHPKRADKLLQAVLLRDPSHARAHDLLASLRSL
ncbi:MAG: hypothetical protein ABI600_00395 [Luteolibacter sp.]